jgi:Flp pilus assembly protein TadG
MRTKRASMRSHLHESWRDGDRRERGVVLAFLALVLFTLIVMAGFTIDVANWWWTGQKLQRTADAAALGGVVYMPDDLPRAQDVANDLTVRNGYTDGTNAIVTAEAADRPTRLRVTVESEVDNFFAGIIGFDKTKITRTAVADYAGAVPMGSPSSFLGNDPELGPSDPARLQKLWLNIAGRAATKVSGDRFTAGSCGSGTIYQCSGGTNQEYLLDTSKTANHGYRFRVGVETVQAGRDLEIQVYDPAFIFTGDACTSNMPSGSQLNYLRDNWSNHPTYGTFYNDATTRYAGTGNDFCPGDQDISGRNLNTAFIVRQPDDTPWNDLDNPVVTASSCQPTNYRPIATSLFDYLNPDPAAPTFGSHFDTADGEYIRENFHRWATVCTIPAGSVVEGEYILQVRTNHQPGSPLSYNSAVNTGGHNRYAVRAGFPASSGGVPNGNGVKLFASGKLPIYVNAGTNTTPTFYLARITPGAASRTLRLEFYDIGDVGSGGSVNLQVLPPPDSGLGNFSDCVFQRDASSPSTSSTCSITGMTSGNYNGRMVSVSIPIPADYNCDIDGGCWLRVRLSFNNASPADTTTWSASIDGDPVRLIE